MANRRDLKPVRESMQEPVVRDLDASRGTPLWAYNHYRSRMLTSLLNDLIDLENDGLEEKFCDVVQKSLEYFVNSTTELPAGGFLTGPLYKEVNGFAKLYKEWNGVNGQSADHTKTRRALLVKLRARRQKISNKVRRLQFELSNDLDQKILEDTYRTVGDLIKLGPSLFKNLAGSYSDYLKRK